MYVLLKYDDKPTVEFKVYEIATVFNDAGICLIELMHIAEDFDAKDAGYAEPWRMSSDVIPLVVYREYRLTLCVNLEMACAKAFTAYLEANHVS